MHTGQSYGEPCVSPLISACVCVCLCVCVRVRVCLAPSVSFGTILGFSTGVAAKNVGRVAAVVAGTMLVIMKVRVCVCSSGVAVV